MAKRANKRYTYACGEAMIEVKLNACGKEAYERIASAHDKATLGRVNSKALSAKLTSRRSWRNPGGLSPKT